MPQFVKQGDVVNFKGSKAIIRSMIDREGQYILFSCPIVAIKEVELIIDGNVMTVSPSDIS